MVATALGDDPVTWTEGVVAQGVRFEHVVTVVGGTALDLELPPGGAVALVGPSGGERARLLAVAAGLAAPVSGRVLLDGEPVATTEVGVLDEDRMLIGGLTAVENVATRALARGPLDAGAWSDIAVLLRRLELPESSLHNLAEQLSGGQQQRVALGRALFGRPAMLCLDDPVSELDEATAEVAWRVVAEQVAAGSVALVGLPEADERVPVDRVVEVGG